MKQGEVRTLAAACVCPQTARSPRGKFVEAPDTAESYGRAAAGTAVGAQAQLCAAKCGLMRDSLLLLVRRVEASVLFSRSGFGLLLSVRLACFCLAGWALLPVAADFLASAPVPALSSVAAAAAEEDVLRAWDSPPGLRDCFLWAATRLRLRSRRDLSHSCSRIASIEIRVSASSSSIFLIRSCAFSDMNAGIW